MRSGLPWVSVRLALAQCPRFPATSRHVAATNRRRQTHPHPLTGRRRGDRLSGSRGSASSWMFRVSGSRRQVQPDAPPKDMDPMTRRARVCRDQPERRATNTSMASAEQCGHVVSIRPPPPRRIGFLFQGT